jgi:hypothetical protein
MDSLRWVDQTYMQKHKSDNPENIRALYYPNLQQYSTHKPGGEKRKTTPLKQAITLYLTRYGRKAAISLAVLALSYLPYVGRFVLPVASFYTFSKSVGPQPALVIFGISFILPKRYLISFLQAYFSSRTLMRELVSLSMTLEFSSTDASSLNPTSPEFITPRKRRRFGSKTGPACSLASGLASSFSSKFPLLES